jgi:hypothetical protein
MLSNGATAFPRFMASGEEDEQVTLNAGMRVKSADEDDLGTLDTVLVDESTEEAAFVLVGGPEDKEPRLLPWDVIMDVKDEVLVVDVSPEEFAALPQMSADRQPTEAEIALALEVLGFDEEDDEEEAAA